MGNCAGYCMSEDANNKKKITVEQQQKSDNIAYINMNQQEFEIEYGNDRQGNAQMGGAYHQMTKGQTPNIVSQGGPEGNTAGIEGSGASNGQIHLPNGSVYTGER